MRVRITVDHPYLAEVDVTEHEDVLGIDGDRARAQIDRLLENAAEKIRRAYDIKKVPGR